MQVKRRQQRGYVIVCASVLLAWAVAGSGCAAANLRDANKRLKESNDRLISENNRLEEELASVQKKLTEKGSESVVPAEPESMDAVASDPGRGGGRGVGSAVGKGGLKKAEILPGINDDDVEVFETKQGVRLRISDHVFFPLGQATLSTRGQQILDKVAKVINSHPNHMVRVDGHTDDTPIRKVRHLYPTNWELSSARACTVVRYLVDKGNVNARRIYPAGFSYYRPVSTGRTTGSKSQNRRVEITILNESV